MILYNKMPEYLAKYTIVERMYGLLIDWLIPSYFPNKLSIKFDASNDEEARRVALENLGKLTKERLRVKHSSLDEILEIRPVTV